MAMDSMQTQRFEMKYLIREDMALGIRQFLGSYMKPDEFAATRPNYSYPVHSLYLDSNSLETYQAVQDGEKNRFKLRIRYYGESDRAVYFEIKRRMNDVILKSRAKVKREAVQPLLTGCAPQLRHLAAPDGKQLGSLQEFCRLMHRLRATPRSHVAYTREAWMHPLNNSMRITFDRQIQCGPEFADTLGARVDDGVSPFQRNVVLELKFTDRLPNWCGEMIRAFSLLRSGAPKYAMGIYTMGEHRVSNIGVGFKLPASVVTRPAGAPVVEPAVAVA